jgi:hypothetical protein
VPHNENASHRLKVLKAIQVAPGTSSDYFGARSRGSLEGLLAKDGLMRVACDTGGTFTDLVVEDDDGLIQMFKASTAPADPVEGVLNAVAKAAKAYDLSPRQFLMRGEMFIYGTTHAINAIITGRTAKTAFLTTEGHPDILVIREGGRAEPFFSRRPGNRAPTDRGAFIVAQSVRITSVCRIGRHGCTSNHLRRDQLR